LFIFLKKDGFLDFFDYSVADLSILI